VNLEPFPHIVIDWWFERELLEQINAEFPMAHHPNWRQYRKENEVKYEGGPSMWGDAACEYFDQLDQRTDELGEMFGLPGLSMELVGGGYHLIPPGGRLAMHADFNRSPDTHLFRRLNVLTYLNPEWDEDGGVLKLGANEDVEVIPEMGRTVIFATSSTSWHGHPVPTKKRWRKSVAAYFFSPDPPPGYEGETSTVWL
jgi:Rps23 Pro-64 3,4-dihydroxylase Tpa1-like proline 4-hydroxylase